MKGKYKRQFLECNICKMKIIRTVLVNGTFEQQEILDKKFLTRHTNIYKHDKTLLLHKLLNIQKESDDDITSIGLWRRN